MDVPQHPGGVLDQPTRAQLFRLLGELRRPVRTDELAERLDLHPNGVRAHLEHLREAGMVDRHQQRHGRGRPWDVWSVCASAVPGGEQPAAYADLSRWLVRAVAAMRESGTDLEEAGRAIGREIAPRDGAPDVAGDEGWYGESRLLIALQAMGFRPRAVGSPEGERHYCLDNCPYRDAAVDRQHVVCTLHRGITQGLLDVVEPGSVLTGFRPEDPRQAGCRLEVRGMQQGQGQAVGS